VRFASPAVSAKSGVERFLPKLRECAARIGTLCSEQPSESSVAGRGRIGPVKTGA
jgi:hypothetical protein